MRSVQFELLDCIQFWGRHRGDSIALSGSQNLTYRELTAAIAGLDANLHGVVSPSRIAIVVRQKIGTTLAVLGALSHGSSPVVLNPLLSADIIARCIEDAGVAAAIVASEEVALWEQVCSLRASRVPIPHVELECQIEPTSAPFRPKAPLPSSEWAILYSSGSTGAPKGIERDFESMQTEFLGWCLELGLGVRTRFYVGRPVFYTGGLVLTMAALLAGGAVVLNEVPDDDGEALALDIASSASREGIDWVFLVPDQVRHLLQSRAARTLAGSVRGVLIMGAPISGLEKQALSTLLRCSVRESWGNSESLGTITDHDMLSECPDSIGRPFLDDFMCIVDEDGHECPEGVIGRIAGGQAAGFTRYTARPNDTASTKRNGLIVSEDLGWRDEQGRFYLAGRLHERLTVNGQDLFLPMLEAELRATGLTAPFCLAFRKIENDVEIGLLFESGRVSVEDVCRIACQINSPLHLARVSEIDRLPKTASGKIDRPKASSLLWPMG